MTVRWWTPRAMSHEPRAMGWGCGPPSLTDWFMFAGSFSQTINIDNRRLPLAKQENDATILKIILWPLKNRRRWIYSKLCLRSSFICKFDALFCTIKTVECSQQFIKQFIGNIIFLAILIMSVWLELGIRLLLLELTTKSEIRGNSDVD